MFSGLCLFEATSPYLEGKLVFSCKIHFSALLSSLLGVDKVIQYAVTEWLTDIRKNQLPGILGGVGPMHSVVQLCEFILHVSSPNILLYTVVRLIIELFLILFYLFGLPFACVSPVHGVRDLFWLPIEQYRKDGRIIRGLQRGAASFGTSTASAALELSNRLVQAIQVLNLSASGPFRPSRDSGICDTTVDVCLLLLQATAETVYDILSPTPPLNRFTITEGRAPSSRPRRAAQPADLREGVAKAYDTVREVRSQSCLLKIHYGTIYSTCNHLASLTFVE